MKEKLKHMRGFYGVSISPAVCILPEYHTCCYCVWRVKDTNVLFCPFQSCVRNKSGFTMPKARGENDVD